MRSFFRRLRRRVSRSELLVRLLGLERREPTGEPGIVMIQLDGLARPYFEQALEQGRLPFLKRLLEEQAYSTHSLYAGLPSSTPAVQAELMYGVPLAVPAFQFKDTDRNVTMSMSSPDAASFIAKRLRSEGDGLLAGGSSYSNVYDGGADEVHLCQSHLQLSDALTSASAWRRFLAFLLYIPAIVRSLALTAVELVLALFDIVRGALQHFSLLEEVKFILSRVAVVILVREFITFGAQMDIGRGQPIIHLTYLGYDEQSHRRGPDSAFALWSLKGIDNAIKRIYKSAQRGRQRPYQLWIYSDHGQEHSIPYTTMHGRTPQNALADVLERFGLDGVNAPAPTPETKAEHAARDRAERHLGRSRKLPRRMGHGSTQFYSKGPVGLVYLPRRLDREEEDRVARSLCIDMKAPLVLAPDGPDRVRAWRADGVYELPRDAREIIGDNPFLEEVTRDLIALVQHRWSGDLVLSGWDPRVERPISWAQESGAHAGPGRNEVHGFVMLPRGAPLPNPHDYFRPVTLRQAVFAAQRRFAGEHRKRSAAKPPESDDARNAA